MGNFNLKDLQALTDDFDKVEKFYVDAEQDKYITYNVKFSEKKINVLLKELANTLTHCRDKGIKDFDTDDFTSQYLNFLIFKHFTSVHNELKGKAYSTHKKAMDKFEEVGLLRTFIDHVFDNDEVLKVYDRFTEISNVGLDFIARMEKEIQGLDNLKVLNN